MVLIHANITHVSAIHDARVVRASCACHTWHLFASDFFCSSVGQGASGHVYRARAHFETEHRVAPDASCHATGVVRTGIAVKVEVEMCSVPLMNFRVIREFLRKFLRSWFERCKLRVAGL